MTLKNMSVSVICRGYYKVSAQFHHTTILEYCESCFARDHSTRGCLLCVHLVYRSRQQQSGISLALHVTGVIRHDTIYLARRIVLGVKLCANIPSLPQPKNRTNDQQKTSKYILIPEAPRISFRNLISGGISIKRGRSS